MMTYQAGRDDAPRLKEAGETSLAAGTSAVEVAHSFYRSPELFKHVNTGAASHEE